MPTPTLPIYDVLPQLLNALSEHHHAVLEAPPGAGKTTCVPLAFLTHEALQDQQIIMLEPRRMAARAAAERMAHLLNEDVGQTVGYRIRQESKTSRATRITVVTEGVLTRWLQSDPSLEGIGLVIFDEFHERNLDSDLGLALCLQARELFRDELPPLKLLVMSATLDAEKIAHYLHNAPLIRSEGKMFPVAIHYHSPSASPSALASTHPREIGDRVCKAILHAATHHEGNILAFLPGQGEIRLAQQQLHEQLANTPMATHLAIHPLHGGLSLAEQHAAIAPNSNSRKIVLATDIAETSLTIEGVSIVVDSGLARVPAYDPSTGITRLDTCRISRASSTQRAGRAGRLGPGTCIRLWPESQQSTLAEQVTPEILQADLAPLVLQLLQWGVSSPDELEWLDAPPVGTYQQAITLLTQLEAIEHTNARAHSGAHTTANSAITLSDYGQKMAQFPAHPRLAHLMLVGTHYQQEHTASLLSAMFSERDPFTALGCDFMARFFIASQQSPCPAKQQPWLQRVIRQANNYLKLAQKMHVEAANETLNSDVLNDSYEACAVLLASAYPDRIAQRKQHGVYKLTNGRMAHLDENSTLANEEWLVIADIGGRKGQKEDRIFTACPLTLAHLQTHLPHLIEISPYIAWDERSNKIVAEERHTIGKLCYATAPLKHLPDNAIQAALMNYIRTKGLNALALTEAFYQWQARVMLMKKHDTHYPWPDMSDSALLNSLEDWLVPYLANVRQPSGLKQMDVLRLLSDQLSWEQKTRLDTLAPSTLCVPSGSHIPIDYTHTPPILAVKLQEMFGYTDTPTLINGSVKLSIHLLSPARRPLQITQDLAHFWKNTYNDVKKEMKGRYPKHPWPDNPMDAEATKYTKKRNEKNEGK